MYTVYKIVCLAGLGAVAGGSIELSSNDLTKSGRSLDNIKATWSQSLNVLGNSVSRSVLQHGTCHATTVLVPQPTPAHISVCTSAAPCLAPQATVSAEYDRAERKDFVNEAYRWPERSQRKLQGWIRPS